MTKRYRITQNTMYQSGTARQLLSHVGAINVGQLDENTYEGDLTEFSLNWLVKIGSAHKIEEVKPPEPEPAPTFTTGPPSFKGIGGPYLPK